MKKNGIDSKVPSVDLLSNVLALDPKRRISTKNALMHPYFSTKPLPSTDVFRCFADIPFPNRRFLAPTNNQTNTNQVNVNEVNIRRINANFLNQISVNPNLIYSKAIQSNAKLQQNTRVTRRTLLQERNH